MKILAFSLLTLTVLAGCKADCNETIANRCSETALCDLDVIPVLGCFCPEGLIGNGCADPNSLNCGGSADYYGCSTEGWTARVTFDVTDSGYVPDYQDKITGITVEDKRDWADWFGVSSVSLSEISSIHHSLSTVWVRNAQNVPEQRMHLAINVLSLGEGTANSRVQAFDASRPGYPGPLVSDGAKVYRWKQQTTSGPISVQATGMTVDFVEYSPSCMDTGCWVVDVTYTKGDATGNFNTFYLPRVQDAVDDGWQEDFSFDRNFQDSQLPGLTFLPKNFPCGSNVDRTKWNIPVNGHIKDEGASVDAATSSCCIPDFLDWYRPTTSFSDYFAQACQGDVADWIAAPEKPDGDYNVDFPHAEPFDNDDFVGVQANVTYLEPLDYFIDQHRARIFIDEADLRRRAGKLKGTVGVEYTVDTFIGYANFRPTGTYVLDAAAMQVNIHLEKTNFFSVSTQGENAYTFLEYVNMRLVTIYKEDVVFGGESETGGEGKTFDTNFYKTSSEGSADYVQVTFTMGSQYSPNLNGGVIDGGLIPLSSVRAGQGTFFSSAEMEHKCLEYITGPSSFGEATPSSSTTRRAEIRDSDSQVTSRTERPSARRQEDPYANPTEGPLDSCQEQSRCMYMEWNQIRDDKLCATGDCEWEVCVVFDDSHDEGCRVYSPDEYTGWAQKLCFDDPTNTDISACNTAFGPIPSGNALIPNTQCWCIAQTNEVADTDPNSHYGNLYQWCDKTQESCPADTDYPSAGVEYFELGATQNISRGSKMCQRGKPGQKLFFVMQDGENCNKWSGDYLDAYHLPDALKALWAENGHPFPESAYARCEPRDEANNQCRQCEGGSEDGANGVSGTDWRNVDGTNPCGCQQKVLAALEEPDVDEVIGFDSCTGSGNTAEDAFQAGKECVWTVVLPNNCDLFCPEGVDKETGDCEGAGGSGGDCLPGDPCCGTFNERLCQPCAPDANMCVSPETVPDNFVSFNIPLGIDWYPEASATLSENVFVHMVVNALDSSGCANPNSGCDPKQVKTTLFGSIPVVTGGLNIFCDAARAKTDLKDVANADLVVGTAQSAAELSRLRILRDIASTSLSQFEDETTIDSDSIEAGFLTFIVKGNTSYFEQTTTGGYGLELEDLITIHIMEPGTEAFDAVQALLDAPPSDNYDTNSNTELLVDGYELNGAFRFEIDRTENRAFLEPREALLSLCPFNPVRGNYDVPFPVTCVTRRDVRYRGFPHRLGASSTAMEVVPLDGTGSCGGTCDTGCTIDDNAKFMQTVLGASDYADALGRNYSCVIAKEWNLDGRYKRGWWINPGYEWTPTQTGGQPKFTVSQKIFLFALVNLNEKFGQPSAPGGDAVHLTPRRRALLSNRRSNTDKTGAGLGAGLIEYEVNRKMLMASAFDVPVDKVATWKVKLGLTSDEACMQPAALQSKLRATLNDIALNYASSFEQLLITSLSVDRDGLECPDGRRSIARQLLASPAATVEMMIVFKAGVPAMFDSEGFSQAAGILDFDEVEVSPKVATGAEAGDDFTNDTNNASDSGSGNKLAIIVGCVVGGVVLLLGAAFVAWRLSKPAYEAEVASPLPDLASLKSQLAEEARA